MSTLKDLLVKADQVLQELDRVTDPENIEAAARAMAYDDAPPPVRQRGAAAGQGGRGVSVSNAPRGVDRDAHAVSTPKKPSEPKLPDQPLSRARREPAVLSGRYRIQFSVNGGPWTDTSLAYDNQATAIAQAAAIHRVQPHVRTRILDGTTGEVIA